MSCLDLARSLALSLRCPAYPAHSFSLPLYVAHVPPARCPVLSLLTLCVLHPGGSRDAQRPAQTGPDPPLFCPNPLFGRLKPPFPQSGLCSWVLRLFLCVWGGSAGPGAYGEPAHAG
eukprot:3437174-Rhodomonas_salina.1